MRTSSTESCISSTAIVSSDTFFEKSLVTLKESFSIISSLKDSARVEAIHPAFKKLFEYVKSHDLLNAPLGRIELDGNNLFLNNMETTGDVRPLEFMAHELGYHIVKEKENGRH